MILGVTIIGELFGELVAEHDKLRGHLFVFGEGLEGAIFVELIQHENCKAVRAYIAVQYKFVHLFGIIPCFKLLGFKLGVDIPAGLILRKAGEIF